MDEHQWRTFRVAFPSDLRAVPPQGRSSLSTSALLSQATGELCGGSSPTPGRQGPSGLQWLRDGRNHADSTTWRRFSLLPGEPASPFFPTPGPRLGNASAFACAQVNFSESFGGAWEGPGRVGCPSCDLAWGSARAGVSNGKCVRVRLEASAGLFSKGSRVFANQGEPL